MMEKITAKMARLKNKEIIAKQVNEFNIFKWMEDDEVPYFEDDGSTLYINRVEYIYKEIERLSKYGYNKLSVFKVSLYERNTSIVQKEICDYIKEVFEEDGFKVTITENRKEDFDYVYDIEIDWENAEDGKAIEYKYAMEFAREKYENDINKEIEEYLNQIYRLIDIYIKNYPEQTQVKWAFHNSNMYYKNTFRNIRSGILTELKHNGFNITETNEDGNIVFVISWKE